MITRWLSASLITAVLVTAACNDTSPVATGAAETTTPTTTPSLSTQAGAPHYQARMNGEFASYQGYTWDGGTSTWVYVTVSRNFQDAWLYISLQHCVQGEEWWEYRCDYSHGSGPISPRDFTGNLQQGLVLNTDTRTNPNFHMWNGEGGQISLRWRPNGWHEMRESGSREFRWMHYVSRSSGTSRHMSADVSGSIFGSSLPVYGSAGMGSTQNVSISFARQIQ